MRMSMTPAMEAALLNVLRERPIAAGLQGRSAHGGLENTINGLLRRGWIDRNLLLTEAGRAALYQLGHDEAIPPTPSE
jgi:hypothetical protein